MRIITAIKGSNWFKLSSSEDKTDHLILMQRISKPILCGVVGIYALYGANIPFTQENMNIFTVLAVKIVALISIYYFALCHIKWHDFAEEYLDLFHNKEIWVEKKFRYCNNTIRILRLTSTWMLTIMVILFPWVTVPVLTCQ